MPKKCSFCVDDDSDEMMCQTESEVFLCTRPKGHKGQHVACGDTSHAIHRWGPRFRVGKKS